MSQKVTVGRIVNFVVAEGEIRPMTVVKVWDNEGVNGVQLRDGSNDDKHDNCVTQGQLQIWRTSVNYDAKKAVGTWHWPDVAGAKAAAAKASTAKAPAAKKTAAAKKPAAKTAAKKKK